MSHFDPEILVSKAATMQRIADAIAGGYHHHISGIVPLPKAPRLVQKFDERYGLNLSPDQRYRRKRKGHSNVRIFLFPVMDSASLNWWLLRTDGDIANDHAEQWLDARKKNDRLIWDGYQVVRLPLAPALAEKYRQSGKVVTNSGTPWTWSMTKECFEMWHDRVRKSGLVGRASGNYSRLRQDAFSLAHIPGFRGLRADVFHLDRAVRRALPKEFRGENQRARHGFAVKQRWMRKRTCAGYPLSACLRQYEAGSTTWFPVPYRERIRAQTLMFPAKD